MVLFRTGVERDCLATLSLARRIIHGLTMCQTVYMAVEGINLGWTKQSPSKFLIADVNEMNRRDLTRYSLIWRRRYLLSYR